MHIGMELTGANELNVSPNVNKNWRLFMNFMVSTGLSFKSSSDTMHEVRGQVYADLACYLLSNDGKGPIEIVVVPTTGALPINGKTEHSIYILCEPHGGKMSFTS
jgi:hypothetical protein